MNCNESAFDIPYGVCGYECMPPHIAIHAHLRLCYVYLTLFELADRPTDRPTKIQNTKNYIVRKHRTQGNTTPTTVNVVHYICFFFFYFVRVSFAAVTQYSLHRKNDERNRFHIFDEITHVWPLCILYIYLGIQSVLLVSIFPIYFSYFWYCGDGAILNCCSAALTRTNCPIIIFLFCWSHCFCLYFELQCE